jgi:hypothetical protein
VTLRLVRDGTIVGPEGTQVDLRTEDSRVWITVKGDSDDEVEIAVGKILMGDVVGDE